MTSCRIYRPELMYVEEKFVAGGELWVGDDGRVLQPSADRAEATVVEMPGKAMLPGFVNVHSHSFQRLIRGKSESRVVSGKDFWSWRGTMYHAASRLTPEQAYDAARMAFLEMLLAGTTTVGEFHYLHNAPDGRPYSDPNLMAKQVIAAARSVGIRIVLLRTAYLRAGFEMPKDEGQARFYETGDAFLQNMDALMREFPTNDAIGYGVAPHSIRAVPLLDLKRMAAWAKERKLPLHMHVAEQVAENAACVREYGVTPVELLAREGVLGADFTAVHAVHVSAEEMAQLAQAQASLCSCPTTERNLGDGIVRADDAMRAGIRIGFGSDSQAQIDPLEDARELDYHLRLKHQERAILDQIDGRAMAGRLFECATVNGARSLGVASGSLKPGEMADFFTIDINDVSVAGGGVDDLLPMVVFGMGRSAIRDVVVGGRMVLEEQRHPMQEEIVSRYRVLHEAVWRDA